MAITGWTSLRFGRFVRTVVALVTLAPFTPAWAQGCGPTRLKVSESVDVDLTPAQTWALVGNFQDLAWDPRVRRVSGEGGNSVDQAKRVVETAGGSLMEESLYQYDADGMSYAYHVDRADVTKLPVQNMSVTVGVQPATDGHAKVTWRAAFYRNLVLGEGAADRADEAAREAVVAFARLQLAGLGAKGSPRS